MLNMDFSLRVVIDTQNIDWQPSPVAGVQRKPLAREAAERGHATSIVQFEPGARFSEHPHPLGEEILVLDGVFSDQTGDYPAGTYFRNPEGFSHAPFSREGCVLLVKLHQFQPGDEAHVVINTVTTTWSAIEQGPDVIELHRHADEQVVLERWPAQQRYARPTQAGGEEIYVLSGVLRDEQCRYPAGTWLRLPPDSSRKTREQWADEGTVLWIKHGHLLIDQQGEES